MNLQTAQQNLRFWMVVGAIISVSLRFNFQNFGFSAYSSSFNAGDALVLISISCILLGNRLQLSELVLAGSIVALGIGVLLRLSRLDVNQADPGSLGQVLEPDTDIFWAVVHAYRHRFTAPCGDLVQDANDALGW